MKLKDFINELNKIENKEMEVLVSIDGSSHMEADKPIVRFMGTTQTNCVVIKKKIF